MKPIILKAVTGSIFLLVVASALYFFTRTIFVYQERSKAAGEIPQTDISRSNICYGTQHCTDGNVVEGGACGECAGLGNEAMSCSKGTQCDTGLTCTAFPHKKMAGLAGIYPMSCSTLGITPQAADAPIVSNIVLQSISPSTTDNARHRVTYNVTFKNTSNARVSNLHFFHMFLHKGDQWVDVTDVDEYLQANILVEPKTQMSTASNFITVTNTSGAAVNITGRTFTPYALHNRLYDAQLGFLQMSGPAYTEFDFGYLEPGETLKATLAYDAATVSQTTACQGVYKNVAGLYYTGSNNTKYRSPYAVAGIQLNNPVAGSAMRCSVAEAVLGSGPGGGGATNTPTKSPTPTPIGVGEPCQETDQCGRGLICKEQDDEVSTCQPGVPPGDVCNDDNPLMRCGKDYYCADKNEDGNGVCKFKVCEPGGSLVGCVTATPTPTASKTPTPTPYAGEAAPVCTNHSDCGARPYYVLIEKKDQENKPIYELRHFAANNELPSDAIYSVVSNGIVVEPPTVIASGEFLETAAPLSRYATIPFQYLFRVKVQDNTTAKNMRIYVGSANMTAPPWTIKTEEQGSVTYKVFLRPGLTEIITSTPTRTPTATPTPEGFNLYLDPAGTDPEKDAVELRLETGVRQGARRGERFSMRIVASPKNTNLRSEFIFLKEVKIPVQYALPVNPNSIILESIKTTNNVQCVDYRLDDPQEDEIGTVSAFYLRAVFKNNTPKQLAADTCIAEFTFDVKDNAQYNDSATVKLLTDEESEGIGEVDTVPALKGMYALAYHLERNAPTTTPAVTPATIHPKVNLSYDDANRSKTVRVDTSRSVAANAADLIVQSVDLIRVEAVTPTACGPVNIRVVVKNQGQSAADPFSISVNGQKKASTQSEPSVSNGGLGIGGTKTYHFDRIKFNADGPNTIFVDSEDKVIEFREDNNYINKKFVFADIPGNTNTQCPNPTNTPTNTPTPTSLTPTPTYIPDPNKINLVMTVKLQGVNQGTFSNQYSRLKFGVAVGGGNLTANTEYIYNDFVHKGDGRYEGVISFDPTKVAVGSGYRIIVKGPKHLAKRFCVAAPTGGYAYFCPANTANISLRKGINNFDFTNVQLIAGDVPNGEQDGVVDSSDLAFIRDNLGIKLPEIIKIGDLNLDGIIDTQDYSMVINNLVNNEDEN